ncbi:MAG: hypothetical protein EOP49_02520 [Sphingobacteriales bacterium]|nr:MAG: hypothetical protein EOP49_02520 [Sphingobacteriales bacterium]
MTPLPGNQLRIEYLAKADPAGAVPAWIANMFVTKGPYETFVQLRKVVARPAYQLAKFDWIKD